MMSKYPGMVRLTKDGHTYLIDGLNLDLGGHLPDAGREEDMAQKAAIHTPEEQREDMPGKDEAKWGEAKAQALKEFPGLTETNPRLWKAASTIYKSLGGKLSKDLEKSMATIDALEKITPTFIQDPHLWLGALKKSGIDYKNPAAILSNLGLTIKCYAEMGGQLMKSSMLEKAASHKYADKVAKPGGGFRYIYAGEETGGKKEGGEAGPAIRKPAPDAKAAPEGKKAAKTPYAKTIDALSAKNDAEAKAALQNVNYEHLAGMHGEMKASDPKRKLVAEMMAEKKSAAVREQAAAKEKGKTVEKSQSQDGYETFEKKNAGEVRASLRKSHPEWDAATLESRTTSQLRQLFKFQ